MCEKLLNKIKIGWLSLVAVTTILLYVITLLWENDWNIKTIQPLEIIALLFSVIVLLMLPRLLPFIKSVTLPGGFKIDLDAKTYGGEEGSLLQRKKNHLIPLDVHIREIGVVYHKLGDNEKAIKHYKEAIEIAKNTEREAFFYCDMAIAYKDLKEFKNAEKYATISSELCKELTLAWFVLAIAQFQQGKTDKAMKNLEKAFKLNKKVEEWTKRSGNKEYFAPYRDKIDKEIF